MSHQRLPTRRSLLLLSLLAAACGDRGEGPLPTDPTGLEARRISERPGPLVTVPVGSHSATIWPYLSSDLKTADDPVNLIISGEADPRAIRSMLLGLDGNRTAAFPAVAPFNCTWSDAIGGLMAGFSENAGWGGAAVQLQCGEYGPMRFHLRLVRMGKYTLANAHFEILIPGTTDHQVVSWELAEQLVSFDLARTGRLGAPPAPTATITPAPTHRAIIPPIYNGLPAELRALIGGPAGDVSSDVGIANDGRATALVLTGRSRPFAGNRDQEFTLEFNQVIPKPFCAAGPADYVLVQGPVRLRQEVRILPTGDFRQVFRARGELTVYPIDLDTGMPVGAPLRASVREDQDNRATDKGGSVIGTQRQELMPSDQPGAGELVIRMVVKPGGSVEFDRKVVCR